MKVEFCRHNLSKEELREVEKVIKSLFLTTAQKTDEFEKEFAGFLGVKYAVGVSSCTAAMHLALLAWGVKRGDEVITTPLSFMATANSILYAGAKPVFVDVEKETGNINADLIEKVITKKTKAILPVHLYGQMADMKKIKKIADRHNLIIIEDSAHCIEGQRDGIRPGQLSQAACFSFHAIKTMTSGEGGAIGLNDDARALLLRKLRLHGMTKSGSQRYFGKEYQPQDMEELGWKYNMSEIQAAILLPQVKKLNGFLERREEIASFYRKAFSGVKDIRMPVVLPGVKHAHNQFVIWVDPRKRDLIINNLKDQGVGAIVNFYPPIHLLKFYRRTFGFKEGDFPVAESISKSTISLPLYPKLTNQELNYAVKTVKEVISNN